MCTATPLNNDHGQSNLLCVQATAYDTIYLLLGCLLHKKYILYSLFNILSNQLHRPGTVLFCFMVIIPEAQWLLQGPELCHTTANSFPNSRQHQCSQCAKSPLTSTPEIICVLQNPSFSSCNFKNKSLYSFYIFMLHTALFLLPECAPLSFNVNIKTGAAMKFQNFCFCKYSQDLHHTNLGGW